MKFPMTTVLTDINGEEELKLEDGTTVTLRVVVQKALGTPLRGGETMSDADKYDLFRLGRRCKANEVHFSAGEITIILERVSKCWPSPVVYGQVKDLLDPPEGEAMAGTASNLNGAASQVPAH